MSRYTYVVAYAETDADGRHSIDLVPGDPQHVDSDDWSNQPVTGWGTDVADLALEGLGYQRVSAWTAAEDLGGLFGWYARVEALTG